MSEHAPQRSSEFLLPTDTEHAVELYRQNPRGLPETWGAVPLATSCEIQVQQNHIHEELRKLFGPQNVPEYVSSSVASFIEGIHLGRVENRESKNRDSYAFRGNYNAQVPVEHLDILMRSLDGSASPAELLYMRDILRMPSVELGSLTHPYGQRLYPYIDEMRLACKQAIVMHGGAVELPQDAQLMHTKYEVKSADNMQDSEKAQALHMTRKRTLGVLPDGTYVVERSSFIVLIDALPDQYKTAIRAIPALAKNQYWHRQIMRRANKFHEFVPKLLDEDAFEAAIPLSTTIVAINDVDSEALLSEEAIDQRLSLLTHGKNSSLI